MNGRPDRQAGSGWAVAGAFAGQAVMLVAVLAAIGLSHGSAAYSAGEGLAVPAPPGAILTAPSPAVNTDSFPVIIATGGQAGKDVFPDGAPVTDFTVAPGADLTFTVTMNVPAGADMTDASLLAAPGSLGKWGLAGALPVATSQPIAAGAVSTFTVRWDGSARDLTPGSQWTLILSVAGAQLSAEAPVAQVTVSG